MDMISPISHLAGQCGLGATKTTPHCSFWDLQDLGELGTRHFLPVVKLNDGLLIQWDTREGFIQAGSPFTLNQDFTE